MTADITPEDQELLGSLMCHLLPTPVVSPPKATPIPSECDLLIQSLMGKYHPVQPLRKERSSFTDMEIFLQNFLPVVSSVMEQSRPTERKNRSTVVCFSCGKSGLAASRCPTLDEKFPFLRTGWRADRVGDGFAMRSPGSVMIVDPRTLPIVRGLPILQPGIRLFPERGLCGLWRPLFHWVVQLCSDSEVSDDGSSSGGGGSCPYGRDRCMLCAVG